MMLVARGTTLDGANPRLTFIHQVEGILADVSELAFAVFDTSTDERLLAPIEVQAFTAVDVNAASLARLGVGRYAATWTVPADLAVGAYEVRWRYTPGAFGSQAYEVVSAFEVVAALGAFAGPFYCGLAQLRREGFTPEALPDARALAAIQRASAFIERVTKRFFEPRYLSARADGAGRNAVLLDMPVIGVDEVVFDSYAYGATREAETEDAFRVYNRHLQGMINPDDRASPKIEMFDYGGAYSAHGGRVFPRGRLNVRIAGVFGFTDADGTPWGRTPEEISRVAMLLVGRDMVPLGNPDAREDARWRSRLTGERTRDQSYTLASPKDVGLYTGFTGDPDIDHVLLAYLRPIMVGGV